MSGHARSFSADVIVSACECKRFKQILLHMAGFECPHHNMVSPPFVGPYHLPKLWGKKPKATTKVILMSHQILKSVDLLTVNVEFKVPTFCYQEIPRLFQYF